MLSPGVYWPVSGSINPTRFGLFSDVPRSVSCAEITTPVEGTKPVIANIPLMSGPIVETWSWFIELFEFGRIIDR